MLKQFLETLAYWLKLAFLAALLAFVIRGFIWIPMKVDGNSMAKTLQQGDQLVYEKFTRVKRFDVVIFRQPDGSTYIKRIIGLPGESVAYKDDELFIDGKKMTEPFLGQAKIKRSSNQYTSNFDTETILGKDKISDKAYFVLGDNRRLSKDSRSFGEIKEEDIFGKAVFIYYPFKHLKFIH